MTEMSIVIVSWNAKKYLRDCLNSIIPEISASSAEIIVVDNASSDGSPEMVQAEFPTVILIQTGSNLGFAKANNIGIRRSTGQYVLLINSDVIVKPGCFDAMLAYMNRFSQVGLLGPKILEPSGEIQRSCMEYPSLWNTIARSFALDRAFPNSTVFSGFIMGYWQHDTVRAVDTIYGCFWMIRRSVLDDVGGLDETFFMYGEDVDFCKRVRDAGYTIAFLPGAEAIHFGGASSANAPVRFYVEMQKANLQLWRKHHGWTAYCCFLTLSWTAQVLRVAGEGAAYVVKPSQRSAIKAKMKRNLWCLHWMMTGSKAYLSA